MSAERGWHGPFDTLPEAQGHRVTDVVGGEVMYVCDAWGRWFVVPAERIENFAGYIARRTEREHAPIRDERGPWLA